MRSLLSKVGVVVLLLTLTASAEIVPYEISYQGRLTDTYGNPVTDGIYNITFTIYLDEIGVTDVWTSNPIAVDVADGLFNVTLSGIDETTFAYLPDAYLGIKVGLDPELRPLTKFSSAPYALLAQESYTGGGWTQSEAPATIHTRNLGRKIGIDNFSPNNTLSIGSSLESKSGYWLAIGDPNEPGIMIGHDDDNYGYFKWNNDSGVIIAGAMNGGASNDYSLRIGKGNVSIGTNPRSDMLLRIDGTRTSSVSAYGQAIEMSNYGVGSTFGSWVKGERVSYSSTSNNVYGVYGYGTSIGDYGNAVGVSGYGSGGYQAIGVYGTASGGDWISFAGLFDGKVDVNGILSKNSGSFKIDHPLDPTNKYLQHSFVESPDMMNVYNGNVVLDADGAATVQMPDWFEALNRDFRYQLTCIGGFAPVYISQEISDDSFAIAGGTPGLKVSWQVTGIRHDPWAEAHRIEVEVDKNELERGYYRNPEVYGLDESASVRHHLKSAKEPQPTDIVVSDE